MLKQTIAQARSRLRRAVEQIPELQQSNTGTEEFKKWSRSIRIAISHAFGEESQQVDEFRQITFLPNYILFDDGSDYAYAYRDGMSR